MNYDSFSHGQIHSKIWLCEELEKHLPDQSDIYILGCWYNVLGFMMMVRGQSKLNSITGVDIDSDAIKIADKFSNSWAWMHPMMKNICEDANTYDYCINENTVVVNCSSEHFNSNKWFTSLPKNTLVCIQSTNVTDPNSPWFITQPTPDFDSFIKLYPVSHTLFKGTKRIQYGDWGYDRYMVIGLI
jgi:hypothetical protein